MSGTNAGRGGHRRVVAAAVIGPLIVAIAIFALWPRADTSDAAETPAVTENSAHHGSTPHSSSRASAASTPPLDSIGAPITPPPDNGSIGSTPHTSLGMAAGAADQTTRDGARGLGSPRDAVDVSAATDPDTALGGCSEAYGSAGQCLPVIPPSMAAHATDMLEAGIDPLTMPHAWSCEEVRTLFADGIPVRAPGVDPSGLDSDGDDTACERDG